MSDLLGAVNRCLRAIGEAPVNSTASGHPDAGDALEVINSVTSDILTAGWHHNTSRGVLLSPSIDKRIVVPSTYIRVDSVGEDAHINVTIRQYTGDGLLSLFNITDNTFLFDRPIKVDIVHYFEFEANPFHVREYIAARSARIFQETAMGSVSLDSFTMRAEAEAWSKFLDGESINEDHNILKDSPYMASITGRNNPLRWR